MRTVTAHLFSLVLVVACALPVVAGDLAGTGDEGRRAVTLRFQIGDRPAEVIGLEGEAIRIHDHERDMILELVPVIQPQAGRNSSVAVEVYTVRRVGDQERADLLQSVLLPARGDVTVSSQWPVRVEFVAIGDAEIPMAAQQPNDLRPRNCCVTCDGVSVCGFCVEMSCGACCAL